MKKAVETIKKLIANISAKTGINQKFLPVLFLVVTGTVLLIISEIKPVKADVTSVTDVASSAADSDGYVLMLEERLVSIISTIDGAGSTKVMVTLESGNEEIYLHNYNYGEDVDPNGSNSVERKDDYVIIDGESGEEGIVVRVQQPKVRGVAVVCEGGGSDVVREQIINTVAALLDISSAKISVAKMN